jgi:hypothetical protein
VGRRGPDEGGDEFLAPESLSNSEKASLNSAICSCAGGGEVVHTTVNSCDFNPAGAGEQLGRC